MTSYSYGLAKGLREPCSPYREAYYFGAELNRPSADGWNCLPELINPTTSYNLSTIPESREVVVALLKVRDTPSGTLSFKAEWYRNRDNALLFPLTWSFEARAGGWVYFYAYLGYVPWEINENGGYRVEFTISGALEYFKVIQLTISGIREVVEPEPIPIGAMGWISERFTVASGFFYQVYLETLDWIYPFWLISGFFYSLSQVCSDLAWDFYDFSEWVEIISDRILGILSWDTIWDWILSYVPNLSDIRDWFYYWWSNVFGVVVDWWNSTQYTVRAWIDEAVSGVRTLVDQIAATTVKIREDIDRFIDRLPSIDSVIYWWSNWTGNVISVINTWWTGALTEVSALISSAFIERESWWAGWSDLRDQVVAFFSDPLGWLESRFTDWFLGPEV